MILTIRRLFEKDSEYGIQNRPVVRYFRPLIAEQSSTKCGNNRPLIKTFYILIMYGFHTKIRYRRFFYDQLSKNS